MAIKGKEFNNKSKSGREKTKNMTLSAFRRTLKSEAENNNTVIVEFSVGEQKRMVLEMLSSGIGAIQACLLAKVDQKTLFGWMMRDDEFREQYNACKRGQDLMFVMAARESLAELLVENNPQAVTFVLKSLDTSFQQQQAKTETAAAAELFKLIEVDSEKKAYHQGTDIGFEKRDADLKKHRELDDDD